MQIGSAVAVPSVNFRTGFTLRGQLTGTNPTTIRVKAWTGSEPAAWQYTATDSAGPQVAGRAGLRSYASSSTTQRAAHADGRQLRGERRPRPSASSAATATASSASPASPASTPPPPPATATASAAATGRSDRHFTRTLAGGWGTCGRRRRLGARSRGAATSRSTAPPAASGSRQVAPNRAIFLRRPASTGTSRRASRSTRLPTGGSAWLYHELRRSTSNANSYRLLARFASDGTTSVSASRVVNGAEAQIGSPVAVPSVNYRTGFTLRGQLTGTNPTTIRIKAWTGTEPATWQYTATDSAGPQVAGRAGLRSYTSSGTDQRAAHAHDRQLLGRHDGRSAAATASAPATSAAAPPPPPPR